MWCKPIDDSIFQTISPIQYKYYAEQIKLDEQEDAERVRDYIEYLARFTNNEAVNRIQTARREKKEVSDDQFNVGLEMLFGHSLAGEKKGRPEDLIKGPSPVDNRPDDIRVVNKSSFSSKQQND